MNKYKVSHVNKTTIVEIEGAVLSNLKKSIEEFITSRRGYWQDEVTYKIFILPRIVSERHLQMLFDELNIPLANSFSLKPKPHLKPLETQEINKNALESSCDIEIENLYIAFGKFKGMKYIHLETNYLNWLAKEHAVKKIAKYAQMALDRRLAQVIDNI